MALAELFQFGHTQSDDVRAKKKGPAFIQNVKKLLQDHDVVVADKLRKAVSCIPPRGAHIYNHTETTTFTCTVATSEMQSRACNPQFAFSRSIGCSTFLTRRPTGSAQTVS